MVSIASKHVVGITTSMVRDISRRRLWPRLDVTVGFFIQSQRTLDGLSQVGDGMYVRERFSIQPLATVSAMISPVPEQRLVLIMETKDMVPLATSSIAFKIVQE